MIETVIEQRLQGHVNVLRGVVGLFDASAGVAPAEWESYLRTVHPETSSPGLRAIGFISRVAASEQTQVEYVHPVEHDNLDALDSDMFTDPIRREAMIRARDQNGPALSRLVRLVHEGTRGTAQPGFLLYLPVYHPGRPTSSVAERRAALRGYVYGVFRSQDLMTSIFGGQQWDLDFEIYDGAVVTRAALLYRSAPDRVPVAGTAGGNSLAQRVSVEIAGHRWLLITRPSATFLSFADRYQHWVIAGGGLAINLLVGIGLWASAAVRKRALVIAEGMSHAVRVSEAQTRLMVDSITDHAIFRLDAERNVTSWNASAERMLGYANYTDAVLWRMWDHLADAVREGTHRWKQAYGWDGPIFAHFFKTEEKKREFLFGMHGYGLVSSPQVVGAVDLGRYKTLVDLGGATGHLAVAACRRWPGLRAVVFDLPDAAPLAKEVAGASEVAVEARIADARR